MEDKRIAVLIDSDNTPHSKLHLIIQELSSFGKIVIKRAYGDFSSEYLKNWRTPLNELAIQPRQQFAYTTGKNSTDSIMIIDAMDLLYRDRFDVFALVSSDSDFTSLATRLRESEIQVIGVGQNKTPTSFRNACDNFVAIENLESNDELFEEESPASAVNIDHDEFADVKDLWRVMHNAWQNYRDESGWAKLGEVGGYLKRVQPDFDTRNYNLKKLSDFFELFPNRYETRNTKNTGLEFRLITKSNSK
jgi:uncharacterized protein (TIGR00288 family)